MARLKMSEYFHDTVTCFNNPEMLASKLKRFENEWQEHFGFIALDGSLHPLGVEVVSVGVEDHTLACPRTMFKKLFSSKHYASATAVAIFHNHPSGSRTPSKDDIALTRQFSYACKFMQIVLVDHLIVTKNGFFSFKRKNPEYFIEENQ